MDNFIKAIGRIRENPSRYLGKESVIRLAGFIDGYLYDDPDALNIRKRMSEFQLWLAQKNEILTSHNWDDLLLFLFGDERSAFRAFYELFGEFYESK